MAQALLDLVDFHLSREQHKLIHYQLREMWITCHLNSNVALVIERKKNKTVISMKSRSNTIKLTPGTFERICDYKPSVVLLVSYMEAQRQQQQQ